MFGPGAGVEDSWLSGSQTSEDCIGHNMRQQFRCLEAANEISNITEFE